MKGGGGGQRFWTVGENMCVAGFVFACFVFANVFVSDGEPSRVCQAPVSMKALISVSFEVHVCLSVCVSIAVSERVALLF